MIDADNSRFSCTMKGDQKELTQCLRAAASFLEARDLESKSRYAVELTLEELLTNALKYGSPNGSGHNIRVGIELDPILVQITVEDNGIPFDPTRQPPPEVPIDAKHAKVGGLGLEMIRKMTQTMHYERDGSENRIVVSIDR
jgi:anti-sigma regulatory factor (Ser/Thr protein kinase)